MAIVQTGSVLQFPGPGATNTGTVSTTITVPADAELVIVGWSGYSTTANYFSTGGMTFTKGGVDTAMTAVSGGDSSTASWMSSMFYLVLPDTGSNKTLKWDWLGTAGASDPGSLCSVTFWKGINTASPVRGSSGGQAGGVPYTSGTITAATGDLIIAWVAATVSGEGSVDSWSNLTLLSQVAASTSADGAWATGSPSGNTTVAASTSTNLFDGGIVAASFKAAASAVTSLPFRQLDQAARRVIAPAILAGGLFWCPQPIAAAPSNTITIDKWQQPLSKAAPVARAVEGSTFVPFNTAQTVVAAVTYDKYQQPLSVAPVVAKAQLGQSVVPFNTAQVNTITIDKWLQPLSKSAPVTQALPGNSFVPLNTLQTNTATIDKWLQPLSIAVPVAKAQPGNSFVPLNTAQLNTVTIDKWLQPFSKAISLPVFSQGTSFVPFDTVQTTPGLVTYDKYQQPLSVVPTVATAQLGTSFVPFNTVQIVASIPWGWQQPLSVAVSVAPAAPGNSFVSFNTALIAAPQSIGWYQQLSASVPVARAQQGNAFIPFDTVQAPPVGIAGMAWFMPLGTVPLSVVYKPQQYSFAPVQFGVIAPSPPAVTAVDDGGGYKYAYGWKPWRLLRKKKLEEELEELEAFLRAIAEAAPKPLAPKPIVYQGPLAALFYEPIEPRTTPTVNEIMAKSKAEAQLREDDDEEALLMLLI